MSGADRYLLDTNAIIALLKGDGELAARLSGAELVGISVVSHLEFMCFKGLSSEDSYVFQAFLRRVESFGLHSNDNELMDAVIRIRRDTGLKLPDAIIGATAIQHNLALLTADTALLNAIPKAINFR
ncbi:type II toxin-antitoxin system VapC family toxin [Marinimicrobium sp.]|uniref:type II toxin-antitoxin system VapC family toxin n=1 Tax=Marinimicrobium sp. TaxID=2024837 RepID=UPI000C6B2E99|nr:type II toxin-antitoxin system VapC family toxin [Marinimicrobium sp.]MAN51535.1 twitching motility protein PilT [Marinimicrobium sp.]